MAEELSELIEEFVEAEASEQAAVAESILAEEEAEDIALLLESLPINERLALWHKIPQQERVEVLVEMRSDPRESLIDQMQLEELDALFVGLNAVDLVELSESLPNRLVERALRAMDEQQRSYFEGAQKYADDLAGHWVDHDVLILPTNAKVRDALRLLRREVPDLTEIVYLVNRSGHFSGAVKITSLFSALDHAPLAELVDKDIEILQGSLDAVEAAQEVQSSSLAALPVVDEQGKLLGRIDVVTAAELVSEAFEAQLMASAGMDEDEDLFAPVLKSAKSRAVWLGINLLTAFLASWVIGMFEATIEQVVALAVLMPVVASMGGISGSQTLTLIIRGLALGQVTGANLKALLKKELSVGGFNGVLWAIVISVVTYFWFESALIGLVIGIAILINICAAAISGVVIPVVLDKLKVDPALSGSVILTTVTDVVGFFAFLGLGSLILL